MVEFPTVMGSWPWPGIGSYCMPLCITRRPLPTYQISLKSNKHLRTDRWGHLRPTLLGRLGEGDLKRNTRKYIAILACPPPHEPSIPACSWSALVVNQFGDILSPQDVLSHANDLQIGSSPQYYSTLPNRMDCVQWYAAGRGFAGSTDDSPSEINFQMTVPSVPRCTCKHKL